MHLNYSRNNLKVSRDYCGVFYPSEIGDDKRLGRRLKQQEIPLEVRWVFAAEYKSEMKKFKRSFHGFGIEKLKLENMEKML